jgi:hypothetical protein
MPENVIDWRQVGAAAKQNMHPAACLEEGNGKVIEVLGHEPDR